MPAAFTGGSRNEFTGPKNPFGASDFYIVQGGRSVGSLKEAFANGGEFTVFQYYNPSNDEIMGGIGIRQRIAEVFGPSDTYIGILGVMYSLRRAMLATAKWREQTPEGKEPILG